MKKHSVVLDGHRTSITLEEPFWQALKHIVSTQKTSLNALISAIDHDRQTTENLSSKIRLYILQWYQGKCHT